MSAFKTVAIVAGFLLMLVGTVFALQGDNVIGGSALMSGNPTYIYAGAAVFAVGAVLIAAGVLLGSRRSAPRSA